MKITVEEIDNLKRGPELDAVIGEHVVGVKIWTHDEMMNEALEVWKEQPNAIYFSGEFKGENWHSDGPKVYQLFSSYSTCPAAFANVERAIHKMGGHIKIGYIAWLYDALNISMSKAYNAGEILRLLEVTAEHKCRAILKAVLGNYRRVL